MDPASPNRATSRSFIDENEMKFSKTAELAMSEGEKKALLLSFQQSGIAIANRLSDLIERQSDFNRNVSWLKKPSPIKIDLPKKDLE